MKRRDFITIIGTAAVTAPVLGSISTYASGINNFSGHIFPELGYSYNALEPYIDARTMELHYDKHHRGYYKKFIAAIEGTELINTSMEDIFAKISSYDSAVRNNGGGYYNHQLFWENMTPDTGNIPSELKMAIEKDFNSVDNFKAEFSKVAKTHFGSGWTWLSLDASNILFVTSTPNQDNPLMDDLPKRGTPLLALDVWEHAYYLKYQNLRGDYVDNFWNVINWETVNKRYKNAIG